MATGSIIDESKSAGSTATVSGNDEQNLESTELPTQQVANDSLALLKGTNMEMFETGELDAVVDNFDNWVANSDNPGKDIFDFLASSADDDEKHVLEWLFARNAAMGVNDGMAESIVRELAIASASDYEQWAFILSMANINTANARNELFNSLPSIPDDTVVAASLKAIQPAFVPPDERTQLLSNMSDYGANSSEEVKAAAIESLGKWSAHDYTYMVEDALANGSDKEKTSAMYAVADGTLRSDDIKFQLIAMINNEQASFEMRMNAFASLSNFSLNGQEYAQFYRFYELNVLPQEKSAFQE